MKRLEDAYEGEWWIPADPSRKVGGILDLGDDFVLRFWGSLEDAEFPPLRPTVDLSVIYGRSLGNALTLLGSRSSNSRASIGSTGGSSIGVRVPLVFIGSYWLDDAAEARFTQVSAGVQNLVDWVNQSPIEYQWDNNEKRSLEYQKIRTPKAEVPGASLELFHSIEEGRDGSAIRWEQTADLYFELEGAEEVKEIDYRFIRPFRYLLDLATGTPCYPGPLQVANPDHLDDGRTSWLHACAYGRNGSEYKASKATSSPDMMFTLQDVDFPKLVPRWYSLVERLGITCDLLFSINAPQSLFVGNKMFNVASAAEGIHQRLYPESNKPTEEHSKRLAEIFETAPESHRDWLKAKLAFSHQLTFAERLGQLIDHAGPAVYPFIGDRVKWIKYVKNIRNQIAHALRERYSFESDVAKLARLTATVEVLLRIVLLRELGFTDEQCAEMAERNPRWSYLKSVLPNEVPEIFPH